MTLRQGAAVGLGLGKVDKPKYLIQEGLNCSSGLQDPSHVVALLCLLGRSPMAAFQISSSKCLKAPDPKFAACATLPWQQCWVSHVTSRCLAQWNGETHGKFPAPSLGRAVSGQVKAVHPRDPTQILHPWLPGTATALSEHGEELIQPRVGISTRKTYTTLKRVAKMEIFPWDMAG